MWKVKYFAPIITEQEKPATLAYDFFLSFGLDGTGPRLNVYIPQKKNMSRLRVKILFGKILSDRLS